MLRPTARRSCVDEGASSKLNLGVAAANDRQHVPWIDESRWLILVGFGSSCALSRTETQKGSTMPSAAIGTNVRVSLRGLYLCAVGSVLLALFGAAAWGQPATNRTLSVSSAGSPVTFVVQNAWSG